MKTLMDKVYLISIFLLASLFAMAQAPTISGTIYSEDDEETLIGATIKAGETGTTSDFNGQFTLQLPEGIKQVIFSYIGYESQTIDVDATGNENINLDIKLKVTAQLLQTATVTSGKFEKPLGEVTVSLEVLQPELLESNNSTSVDEILSKIPGLNLNDGQADIRGGSGWSYGAGSRVLLLQDDIPALQADAGIPNWDDLPMENMAQLEVVKGAASALYGSSALNGIINIRTAYAKSTPVTKASIFYNFVDSPSDPNRKWWTEQPLSFGGSFAHRQKFGKLDLVLGAYAIYRNNFRESEFDRYGRGNVGIRYRLTDRLSVGFNSNFNTGEAKRAFYWQDGADGALRGDTTSLSHVERWRYTIDPFLTYFDKKGNQHKILSRLNSIDNRALLSNQSNSSKLYYGEYQFQKKFEKIDLVTTAGIVGTTSRVEAELYGDTIYSSSNAAAYLQVDKKIGKLNISSGIRYERNALTSPPIVAGDTIPNGGKVIESKPVFRLGLNYQLGEATYLRTSWGQGYRYPTIAEKFIETNAGALRIRPNPNLISETGWSAEIGLKQGFQISEWMGFFDVAFFWSQYQDMMEFTFDPSFIGFQSRNVGDTRISGLDISLVGKGEIGPVDVNILAGYTYIDPIFLDFDTICPNNCLDPNIAQSNGRSSTVNTGILKYRVKHTFKFDVEFKLEKISFGVAALSNSHMENIDQVFNFFIPGVRAYREIDNDGFTTLDLRAAYQFHKNLKVSVVGKNLTNEAYTLRPAQMESPRNFSVRLDAKF